MQELVDKPDVVVLLGSLLVEGLHFGTLVVCQTCGICVEFGNNGIPLAFIDAFGTRIVHIKGQSLYFCESGLPSRIHATIQRQRHLLAWARQRIVGNLVTAGGKILLTYGLNLLDRYINGLPADSRMAKGKFLTADRLTPEMKDYLNRLKKESEAQGHDMAEHALRWVLSQQGVTSVLVGASSVEQLKRNLQCI